MTNKNEIIAEKDGSFTVNVNTVSVNASPPHIVDSGASVMNNKPVAWIDPRELDMAVSTSVTKNKQFDTDIPLYTHPTKTLTDEEIKDCIMDLPWNPNFSHLIDFARAILRKAQEK